MKTTDPRCPKCSGLLQSKGLIVVDRNKATNTLVWQVLWQCKECKNIELMEQEL